MFGRVLEYSRGRGGVPRHIVAQRRGDGSARRQRGAPATRARFACHSRDDANRCDGNAGRFHVNGPARGKTGSGAAMTTGTGTVGAATTGARVADGAHLTATTDNVRAYAKCNARLRAGARRARTQAGSSHPVPDGTFKNVLQTFYFHPAAAGAIRLAPSHLSNSLSRA